MRMVAMDQLILLVLPLVLRTWLVLMVLPLHLRAQLTLLTQLDQPALPLDCPPLAPQT